ncbi:MAG: ArsR/SmtB family transcription factor [Thermoplasmatota archaeon]
MNPPEGPQGMEIDLEEIGGVKGLRKLAPTTRVLRKLERLYSMLSCSRRIEVLYFLNLTELTAGELSEVTGMAPNLLSFHLRKLESAGVVKGEREGRFVRYSITEMGRTLLGPLSG